LSQLKRAAARFPVLGPYLQKRYWEYLEKRRKTAATIPSALDWSLPPDPDFLRAIGYRFDRPPRPKRSAPEPAPPPPPLWPAEDLYFVTVCTANHVPFTRALVESIRRHHGAVPVVVNVVDAPTRDSVSIEGAIVLTGRDTFGPDLEYPSLKFNASELCCAAKAQMIDYLLRHSPARRFVYIDSDLYLFAPVDAMIARLDDADFVVTPHTIAPFPTPEKFWEKPSLGDLANAGIFNAGMFAMRRSEESQKFITTWKWLVVAPGAFVMSQGGQAEQHSFNWVPCFTDSIAVLRDTAYNVAYWNLHDRSLRYEGIEGGEERWTVDGKPLVAFHFSGFSPAKPWQLSKHDNRYGFYIVPAVARLRDFYLKRLDANDRGELAKPYRFGAFPSGIVIDQFMREVFREHEVFLRADVSPWSPEGEAYYARSLLSPIPYSGSLAPILIKMIYDLRPDLRALGDISLDPRPLVNWMLTGGVYEGAGHEKLFDLHRPVVPMHNGAVLMSALRQKWPRLFEGLASPVHADRREFSARLQAVAPHEAQIVRDGAMEYSITTLIGSIRHFVSQRPDLTAAFPDLLFDDAPALVAWLRDKRMVEHFLPEEAIDLFESRSGGRPLARIFSYVSRTWPLMEMWPLAFMGEGSADMGRHLLSGLRHTIEFDLADIELFVWIMETKPWAGLPLTLELPIHTTRHPSSRSRRGQNEILERLLHRDRKFAIALDQYRQQYPPVNDPAPPSRRTTSDISVFSLIDNPPKPRPPLKRIAPGANVFGYHRSDIGLGQMTRGLVEALGTIGWSTSQPVLGNIRMDNDLKPDDFIRKYDVAKGTNIFISYPHMHDSLLRSTPDEVIEGHRNIVYLAWEQRDGTHYWKDVYAEYDQVWALSDFAAESLTNVLERTVHSVPCIVDTSLFPPPSTKELHGVDPKLYTFLFIFDANSSTERKNPEAVVDAFREAFRADDRVRLIIKASSADRMGNRARLQKLRNAIGSDPKIEVRTEDLSRNDLYGLVSACDSYVSLHRGEGFGYTCAEAMVYGKPVIATGYSGNMQFMNETNSYPVRYAEVVANVQEGPFQRGSVWAEPDVAHAAELMRRVYEHRDEAAARGERGRVTIETTLSPAAVGRRVRALLDGEEAAVEKGSAMNTRAS
jgi:glycosyltransferase involved in cell wall biosynthesis